MRLRKSENLQFRRARGDYGTGAEGIGRRPSAPTLPKAQLEMLRSVRIQVKLARREDTWDVFLQTEEHLLVCSSVWRS